MWSGAITFGLVNVPVKMFTAVSPKDVHFHQLRASDGARIEYRKVGSTDKKEVEYKDIVKGYEIAPNQYVKIKPEELEALDPEKRNTIEIERFVHLDEIDPIYFERSYYLVPDKNASKAYALLQQAMAETGKVAIARMVMRDKEYTVALRGTGHAIGLSTLYYSDEVVPEKQLELPSAKDKPQKKELDMAIQLINAISGKFDATEYHDEYRERVMDLIHRKAEGKEIVAQAAPKTPAPNVVNLMEALKASIADSMKRTKGGAGGELSAHQRSKAKPRAKRTA
jgi:DNA end-binding protein Ku